MPRVRVGDLEQITLVIDQLERIDCVERHLPPALVLDTQLVAREDHVGQMQVQVLCDPAICQVRFKGPVAPHRASLVVLSRLGDVALDSSDAPVQQLDSSPARRRIVQQLGFDLSAHFPPGLR